MGSFHITPNTSHQRTRISFASAEKHPQHVNKTAESSDKAIVGKNAPDKKEDPVAALLAEKEQSANAAYLERISPRETQHAVGSATVKVELGYQTEGPQILTRSQEPSLVDQAKALNSQSASEGNFFKDKTFKTGTQIQATEGVSLRVGVATTLVDSPVKPEPADTDSTSKPTGPQTSTGMYAGVKLDQGPVTYQVNMDTALGKPRVGTGIGIQVAGSTTIGVSYQREPQIQGQKEGQTLKIGTEIKANQDTVFGLNVTQPVEAVQAKDTAVGVYLNTKFD